MSCFIRVLKVSLRLTLIQNGGLSPLRLIPLDTEFYVLISLHLAREHFFERLQNYMQNKSGGNENKIILGDFNCTMDVGNKTQRLYRCGYKYALWKLIIDNGLADLWIKENPNSSKFTRYNRSSGTRSRMDRVYIDIKIANSLKINDIMLSFTNHYNAISLNRLSLKTKIGKIHVTLIILFYVNPSSLQLQIICFSY